MAPTTISETCFTTNTGTLLCIPNDQTLHSLSTSTLESYRSSLPCNNPNAIPEAISTVHNPNDDRDWQHYLNNKISHILNSRAAEPEPAPVPAVLLEKRKKKPSGSSSSNSTSAAGHLNVNSVLLWVAVGGIVGALNV